VPTATLYIGRLKGATQAIFPWMTLDNEYFFHVMANLFIGHPSVAYTSKSSLSHIPSLRGLGISDRRGASGFDFVARVLSWG
jgi:hypothetical protein